MISQKQFTAFPVQCRATGKPGDMSVIMFTTTLRQPHPLRVEFQGNHMETINAHFIYQCIGIIIAWNHSTRRNWFGSRHVQYVLSLCLSLSLSPSLMHDNNSLLIIIWSDLWLGHCILSRYILLKLLSASAIYGHHHLTIRVHNHNTSYPVQSLLPILPDPFRLPLPVIHCLSVLWVCSRQTFKTKCSANYT